MTRRPDLEQIDYLRALMSRIDSAPHGDRGRLVREGAAALGLSVAATYRRLQEVGFDSGRKPRADRGRSALPDAEAQRLGALLMNSVRANGKRTMSFKTAAEILRANDQLSVDMDPGTLAKALRRRGMHPDQVGADSPHVHQKSLHPNHVWQIDASVCVLYYLDRGGVAVASEREFYKNKPQNLKRIERDRVIRYVATDHYSGAMYVEYFLGAESSENLYRFFANAIAKRDHPGDPFHGVPLTLMLDRGSASEAHLFRTLLERLDVRQITHLPGNPRAKGSVERSHDLVERNFEARLGVGMRVADLAQLNHYAQAWCRTYCARERHTRHGHTRYALWQTIRPEQLRIAPPRELLDDLLATKPVSVKVRRDLTIAYALKRGAGSHTYSVKTLPEVRVGDLITVCVNPYRAPSVIAITRDAEGREVRVELEPLERDDAGFYVDAAVIGEEIRSARDTTPDVARKRMLQDAYGVNTVRDAEAARRKRKPAFEGRVDALDYLTREDTTVAYMQRRGTALPIEAPRVEAQALTAAQCAKRLREAGVEMSRERYAVLTAEFPEGISEEAFAGLVKRWSVSPVPAAEVMPLRAVR